MATSLGCPRTRIWLHGVFKAWHDSLHRSVSTTAAIRKGLREEKNAISLPRTREQPGTRHNPRGGSRGQDRRRREGRSTRNGKEAYSAAQKGRQGPLSPREDGRKNQEPSYRDKDKTKREPAPPRESGVYHSRFKVRLGGDRKLAAPSKQEGPTLKDNPHLAEDSVARRERTRDPKPHVDSKNNEAFARYSKNAIAANADPKKAYGLYSTLVDELLLAFREGTGPYKDIRKDDLLVRINNTLHKLAKEAPSAEDIKKREQRPKMQQDVTEKQPPPPDRAAVARNWNDQTTRKPALDADGMPVSIPRTTAASTFLYGVNTVFAAMRANRRKLYKLYMHPRMLGNSRNDKVDAGLHKTELEAEPRAVIMRMANDLALDVRKNTSRELLDAMADNRPHNGVVLEASNLPALPVAFLATPRIDEGHVPLRLELQSPEDAAINGRNPRLPLSTGSRFPFVLMLDGILDPQNMGNILRTALFYGVDAVAVSVNTCCSLTSPVLAKASSGACEAIDILAVSRPGNFVHKSKNAGWKVAAAVAPEERSESNDHAHEPAGDAEKVPESRLHSQIAFSSPLRTKPTILMLGAEGEGLRESLKARADYFVSISSGHEDMNEDKWFEGLGWQQRDLARQRMKMRADIGVDSINVGTAAGVLVDCFLRSAVPASNIDKAEASVESGAVEEDQATAKADAGIEGGGSDGQPRAAGTE